LSPFGEFLGFLLATTNSLLLLWPNKNYLLASVNTFDVAKYSLATKKVFVVANKYFSYLRNLSGTNFWGFEIDSLERL